MSPGQRRRRPASRLPAIPFAEERYWVAQAPAKAAEAAPLFTLEDRGGGAFSVRLAQCADTTALIKDGLAGLLLPEIVRAAGQRFTGRTVVALEQMIWGPSDAGNGLASVLERDHPLR